MPKASRRTSHWGWAKWKTKVFLKKTTARAVPATNDSIRNWQSTQSSNDIDNCVKWPWQWWSTHSLQSRILFCTDSWTWSDDRISIGTKTANSNHEAICRFLFTFIWDAILSHEENSASQPIGWRTSSICECKIIKKNAILLHFHTIFLAFVHF